MNGTGPLGGKNMYGKGPLYVPPPNQSLPNQSPKSHKNINHDDDEKKSDININNNNNDYDDIDKLESLPLRIFGEGASKFMCEQCSNVPLKAATCSMGHIFCNKCIIDLCNNNKLCPVCNTQITQPVLNSVVVDNMIKKEQVTCLYAR